MYANFISTNYIFKYSVIDDNVDPLLLEPFIRQAQDLNVQTILGNTLYVKLMSDIPPNGSGPTGYYKELLDNWIQPAVMHWTVYHALPFINYKLTNKAISEKNTMSSSGGSTPTALDTVKYLRDVTRDKAEFYNQRIREYIINNEQYLPEYSIYTNLQSIKPKPTTYFGGIYLKNAPIGGYNNYGGFDNPNCLPGSGLPLN